MMQQLLQLMGIGRKGIYHMTGCVTTGLTMTVDNNIDKLVLWKWLFHFLAESRQIGLFKNQRNPPLLEIVLPEL